MTRKKFAIYVDEDVYHEFEESIRDTGISVSRMIEMVMRANCSKHGKTIGEIFDSIFEMGKKEASKKK